MYWWNSSKLVVDFREGRVDEKERFKYFLATFIAWNVAIQLFIYAGGPFNIDTLISAGVSLAVAVVGIVLCYRVNKSGDNRDFIARMICLGWPVCVQFVVMFSALFFILSPIMAMPEAAYGARSFLSAIPTKVREIWDGFWGVIFIGTYYWAMYRYFGYVARTHGLEVLESRR